MLEFYEVVKNVNPNAKNLAMTVIEGDHLGEKAVVSDQKLIWESRKDGFFSSHLDLVENVSDKGTFSVAGEKAYIETLGNKKKMVICGGGHVSIPIIKIGLMTGFHITVIEDRPMFADNAKNAGAQEVICQDFDTALAEVQGDADTFFVIVTRGHKYDQACLGAIAMKPRAYMGMIGSRRRIAMVKELLINNGIPAENLADLHAPIGLNIGAQTPEEIAVAIIAEVIQVKNQSGRSDGYPPEILKRILEDAKEASVVSKSAKEADVVSKAVKEADVVSKAVKEARGVSAALNKKILATIITRSGSAPRDVGTKMLVAGDGTFTGTVGGGCAEARVMRRALQMMQEEATLPEIFHVDLAADTAEEEGMVCGGQVDVLLEPVW